MVRIELHTKVQAIDSQSNKNTPACWSDQLPFPSTHPIAPNTRVGPRSKLGFQRMHDSRPRRIPCHLIRSTGLHKPFTTPLGSYSHAAVHQVGILQKRFPTYATREFHGRKQRRRKHLPQKRGWGERNTAQDVYKENTKFLIVEQMRGLAVLGGHLAEALHLLRVSLELHHIRGIHSRIQYLRHEFQELPTANLATGRRGSERTTPRRQMKRKTRSSRGTSISSSNSSSGGNGNGNTATRQHGNSKRGL